MIAYLYGKVIAMNGESIILENNGVGYEIFCSGAVMSAFSDKKEGAVYTYLQVKEDGLTLYGFISLGEKELFLKLISVSGVGPKMGIAILSSLSSEEILRCISTADSKRLSSVKGLGKKTAEKIILELHGKISAGEIISEEGETNTNVASQPISKTDGEAVSALMGLGFTRAESLQAVQSAKNTGATTVEEILRLALKSF